MREHADAHPAPRQRFGQRFHIRDLRLAVRDDDHLRRRSAVCALSELLERWMQKRGFILPLESRVDAAA